MAISLTKGSNINLSKEAPGLSKITLGLGWKPRVTAGAEFDLDASAFMLTSTGKVSSDADFIFYKQKESACGSVQHTGDNRNGEGDGDDESINVNLSKVPSTVEKIVFTVTIYEYAERRQHFGDVSNAFIRITDPSQMIQETYTDEKTGKVMERSVPKEIARYDLSEDASSVTAMIFGELYRHEGQWKFKAVGQGFENGLGELARNFGVDVG